MRSFEGNRSRLDSVDVVPGDVSPGSSKAKRSSERRTDTHTKTVREGGGVYVYRTRKPGSLLGLARLPWWSPAVVTIASVSILYFTGGPWLFGLIGLFITGRHFAYVGETVSFKDRHGEHINGGGRWKRGAQPWSDLDPVCVARIPLPRWKWLLRAIETALIVVLAPVYNDKKNKWNMRRITLASARRMRSRRNRRRVRMNIPTPRAIHVPIIIALAIFITNGL